MDLRAVWNRSDGALLRGLRIRQAVILELLPKREFLDLAGCRVWNLVDKNHVIWNPPLCGLALHEAEDLSLGGDFAFLEHDHEQRPLVPFRMRNADHRGLRYFRMTDREILKVDRGNPFASRLDHVLGAVGDLHVAIP